MKGSKKSGCTDCKMGAKASTLGTGKLVNNMISENKEKSTMGGKWPKGGKK
jgi:hypothetical protein